MAYAVTSPHSNPQDIEASVLDFTASGHLYGPHRLHAFAARCPPPLVAWAISTYSNRGDAILDPMVGSGTTLVEAALHGREGLGVEIDPLGRLIALAKATPLTPRAIERATTSVLKAISVHEWDDGSRPDIPDFGKWFRDDVAADLARLLGAISHNVPSPIVRRFLWMLFSSLIVARTSVANARDLVHSRHHYREWTSDPGTLDRFSAACRRGAGAMEDYRVRLREARNPRPEVKIVGRDARELRLPARSVDMIFTSPPYCSALDYTRSHFFAVAWLQRYLRTSVDEYRALGRQYVGSERAPFAEVLGAAVSPPKMGFAPVDKLISALTGEPKKAWILYHYFRDMFQVLGEARRVLKPGRRAVIVVCPSNIRKLAVPTHEIFAEATTWGPARGFMVEALHERTIHDHRRVMPYLEASFGPRMRTEYVLVLRKGA